jgi:hypothetical protein
MSVYAQNIHLPVLHLPERYGPWTLFIYFFFAQTNESVTRFGSYLAEPCLMAGCSVKTNENA